MPLFDHELFERYEFEEIPLNRDVFVVDEVFLSEYEKMMLRFFGGEEYEHVGFVSYAAARAVNDQSVELSWYANGHNRFLEIALVLPRDQFIACVGSRSCDEKERIFVRSEWLEALHLRVYSVFALIDAIGVKDALVAGKMERSRLIELRNRIDELAQENSDVSFISFADSLLLKSNWSIGHFNSDATYTYSPEKIIYLAEELDGIYKDVLGLATYAVIAQGSNTYYNDPLLHISTSQNHICLNSMGLPFAQIMEIDGEARSAIRDGVHAPFQLYMDEHYYHSLKFKFEYEKWNAPHFTYQSKMMATPSNYFCSSRGDMFSNLKEET